MTQDTKQVIAKIQATLTRIDQGKFVAFNITRYKKHGLVKENGKDNMNRTRFAVTQKGKQFLALHI